MRPGGSLDPRRRHQLRAILEVAVFFQDRDA
jgi:hypothetical protein